MSIPTTAQLHLAAAQARILALAEETNQPRHALPDTEMDGPTVDGFTLAVLARADRVRGYATGAHRATDPS